MIRKIGLITTLFNLLVSIIIFILFSNSSNSFQFVLENYTLSTLDFYLGIDGISLYFVLLTVIIMPISVLSNWKSINQNVKPFIVIMLLLETLLIGVFLVLDILLFYIFFESILPPLFILIGLYGASNKVRASFYLFLYTLLGSLFMLLSILKMNSFIGTSDYGALYKTIFNYKIQNYLFVGIFIAFAVKTPVIFLNIWLLKAHVESPLSGSILLAAIVLKLSIYGIFRLMLPLLTRICITFTTHIYTICTTTIGFASFSTIRTIDIKEIIAYSSVAHAAVYLIGAFSNTIQGIEGGILLGIGHGFVSSSMFICVGGALYDRSHTRLITYYRGLVQIIPVFSTIFFILCLGNAGTPLTLNFIGEYMCLYGGFETLPIIGLIASSSIVLSAAYTMYMFNRVVFGGSLSKYFRYNIPDLNKREIFILLPLVILTILFGIYPNPILDGLHFSVSTLLYNCDTNVELDLLFLVPLISKNIRKYLNLLIPYVISYGKVLGISVALLNALSFILECLEFINFLEQIVDFFTNPFGFILFTIISYCKQHIIENKYYYCLKIAKVTDNVIFKCLFYYITGFIFIFLFYAPNYGYDIKTIILISIYFASIISVVYLTFINTYIMVNYPNLYYFIITVLGHIIWFTHPYAMLYMKDLYNVGKLYMNSNIGGPSGGNNSGGPSGGMGSNGPNDPNNPIIFDCNYESKEQKRRKKYERDYAMRKERIRKMTEEEQQAAKKKHCKDQKKSRKAHPLTFEEKKLKYAKNNERNHRIKLAKEANPDLVLPKKPRNPVCKEPEYTPVEKVNAAFNAAENDHKTLHDINLTGISLDIPVTKEEAQKVFDLRLNAEKLKVEKLKTEALQANFEHKNLCSELFNKQSNNKPISQKELDNLDKSKLLSEQAKAEYAKAFEIYETNYKKI